MNPSSKEKIKAIRDLASTVANFKSQGKKVVLCHGVFDVLHPGHIRHLEAAKKEGDILVVSVTPDRYVNKGPGRPIFPDSLRSEVLASLVSVDFVTINEWSTAVETIKLLKPSIFVKGNDYKDREKDVTGGIQEEENAIRFVGGSIVFTNEISFSSSSLSNSLFNLYSQETTAFLDVFRKRVTEEEMTSNVNKTADCKTLVIGDIIIDEYHYCAPMGKSPKENVIVTRHLSNESFAGGVLAAANHLASLCRTVDLVTCLGPERHLEDFVRSHLKKNVNPTLFSRKDAPTTVKRRFVEPSYTRKLFEICFLNGDNLPDTVEKEMYDHLDRILPNYDLVLVTDFGHGLMNPRIIELIARKAKFLAVNAQTNSANAGFNLITKYPRADYICIDEPEARLAMRDRTSPLGEIVERLSQELKARFVTVTHGNNGCIVYSRETGHSKIPAFTKTVVDTVGAGDAFLSISSPCVAMGVPMELVGFIGNAAGALKVGIIGNRSSVEKVPLLKYITTLLR
ncbi:MAG: PfkB family carbohydrate kinase [Candidatus Peregrinibacteria bacterium]|nr:PfkB family carbohydrate kinase [Candidatus Peregrinibacteria bacterium]